MDCWYIFYRCSKHFPVAAKCVEKNEDAFSAFAFVKTKTDCIGIDQSNWCEARSIYEKILAHIPPTKERLLPLLDCSEQIRNGLPLSVIKKTRIQKNNLQQEFEAYNNNPKIICEVDTDLKEDEEVLCPHCYGSLNKNVVAELNRGKLVLCSVSADTWLYKNEKPSW